MGEVINFAKIASKRNGTKVWTPEFRGSFINVHKSKTIPGTDGEPTYSVVMLFLPDADLKHLHAALNEAARDKRGAEAGKIVKSPKFRNPIKDQGDMVSNKTGELYAGMEPGAMRLAASTKVSFGRPQVVDRERRELLDPEDLDSGAWYRATVNAFAWEHPTGGRGVSFGLQNLQKLGDSRRLGGGRAAANDDFEALEPLEATGTDDSTPNSD